MKIRLIALAFAMTLARPSLAGVSLKGTGSFLAGPLYAKWVGEYHSLHPEVKLKYELKNSTDGIRQFLGRGCDFAATDTPLTDEEGKKVMGRAILHLPVAIEALAITYNLPGVVSGLRLSPGVLSRIFMGEIKKWNDPALLEMNPGVSLPNMEILVVHREEESALHDLFPATLAKLDPQWTLKREKDKNLKWPVGQKVKGNEKVLEKLKKWPGVIAAVDFSFASSNHLPVAQLRNESGHFVAPSVESLLAAASDLLRLPEDFQVTLGRSRSHQAYPLCTFSWLLVYQDALRIYHKHEKGKALVDFLNWILGDGQKMEAGLSFAPLPDVFLQQVKEKVLTIKY